MFEGDFADTCGGKCSLNLMGGRVEGLACTDPVARTPIGVIGNFDFLLNVLFALIILQESELEKQTTSVNTSSKNVPFYTRWTTQNNTLYSSRV